jgi:long-subunit acyl-CoA synthetase (AMP-forming)
MSEKKKTVMQVLDETAAKYGPRDALRRKNTQGGYDVFSWREYREQCRKVAKGLIALGAPATKGVAIIGFNSPEWVFANMGGILAGCMPAGIYTTSSPQQARYITHHCEASVAFAENAQQAAKFLEVWNELPHLKHLVQWSGDPKDSRVMSWKDFMAKAESVTDAQLQERIDAQKPDDVCTLIYTSGTTGDPKAVMISHDNLTWTADVTVSTVDFGPDDEGVSYLPLSHVAEQMLTIHGPMRAGFRVTFAESIDKIGETLQAVRPTFFVGVPRVWEKIQAKIVAAGQGAPPMRKKIVAWARKTGLRGGFADQAGESRPLLYPIAEKLVFSKAKEKLGLDRCKLAVTSTAPIARDTLEFFLSLGIPLMEIYGMSECTGPTTFSTPKKYKTGKAGYKMPGSELKIAEDGEVCMRGRHVFKGYLKDEESTKNTLDAEGWLHSGDIGVIDDDGFLRITDRKKELIITAGGENIAPQLIEAYLKAVPVIAQAVALGDRQRFIAALLTLDPERIPVEAQLAGSPARDPQTAATCTVFRAHLEKQIDEHVNKKLARVQNVRKFTILSQELTIEGGELTPTMKLKRRVIAQKYQAEIDALFQ